MSHYSVGVIIKKEDVDKEINELIEGTDEPELNESQKLLVTGKIMENLVNKALEPFDENLDVEPYLSTPMRIVENKFKEIKSYEGDDEYYLRLKNKYKDETLDNFIKGYYEQDYTEKGLLSTYNPNSKWDWYVIGGRWAGALSDVTKKEKNIYDCYRNSDDYAQIKDIKFIAELTEEEIKEYTNEYEKLTTEGAHFFNEKYYKEKYPTLDAYLDEKKTFSTYALLTPDGQWHEPGEMGWFGISSASPKDEVNFKNTYKDLIDQQNPEDYFVLVDCHI